MAIILEEEIDDIIWPEIVLDMTFIKNLRSIGILEEFISPIEIKNQAIPDLYHFCILGSNIYIFFHKKKRSLKSAKWEVRTFIRKLIRFDDYTIYQVFIED